MPSITPSRTRPGRNGLTAALLLLAALATAVLAPADALAHRVNIFAWLEGANIMVECGFNRSAPVREGLVTVYDAADGKELLQGRTDARGIFVFAVPDAVRRGHGLRIEVNAGQGHVNDWTMTAGEILEAGDLSRGFAQARADGAQSQVAAAAPASPGPAAATAVTRAGEAAPAPLTPPEVRAIVGEALASGLAPLRRELAALSSPGPSLRDIVGGLGWIMGLVGIACWFLARRGREKS